MTIAAEREIVYASGHCLAEDAEALLKLLVAGAKTVDLTNCDYLHGAIVQLLMAAKPVIVGEPSGFVREWLIPLIRELDSP